MCAMEVKGNYIPSDQNLSWALCSSSMYAMLLCTYQCQLGYGISSMVGHNYFRLLAKNLHRSSKCSLTGFFWLLSHVIYLKLTKVLYDCLPSQAEWWVAELLYLSLNNWGLNFVQNESSQSSQIYLLIPKPLQSQNFRTTCIFVSVRLNLLMYILLL